MTAATAGRAAGTAPGTATLRRRFEAALMPTYGVPPLALTHGRGSRVWDADGRDYLDLVGGIAVSALGHAHPALVEAVGRQVATLAHTSNLYLHEPEVLLAERLLALLETDGRVFFANSGAEANEAALKLVRKAAGPDRHYVVAATGSFHGRTMGALAVTGKARIRDPFGPHAIDVRFVPYGDGSALAAEVTERCAAVVLEPVQGEGGVVPAPAGYLAGARRACDRAGAALVLDEVQSGIGRTGRWFAHGHDGVRPDVLTLAKGLGGGLPIGACVGLGRYGTVFGPGDHGSTFGGNPVAAAAALAVLRVVEADGLLDSARSVGELLRTGIAALAPGGGAGDAGHGGSGPGGAGGHGGRTRHPLVAGVRGRGLWLGMVLTAPAAPAVEAAARQRGYLVNAVRPDVIRLAPPLILTAGEARAFLAALPGILDSAADEAGLDPRTAGRDGAS
jgi:acetylornithine/N-succinyldiaminopimelate aminotransferase